MSEAPFLWTDHTVREALGLRTETTDADLAYTGVTTDSRTAGAGQLYVALVGERFDGHEFVAEAMAAGVIGAVVSRPVAGADPLTLYPVEDTLRALGDLARYRRLALPARVVGITGSSGKTSTKELTAAALGGALRVHATEGNLNNQIGVPLTLLSAPADAEVLVVEMGTNEPGEIGILTDIARPDLSVVTTVGESHLEKLGSVQGVLKEKLDIVRGLPAEGTAVVGAEPRSLPRTARELHPRVRVAGWNADADDDLRPADVEVDRWGHHRFGWRGRRVSLSVPGRHVMANALIALGVADTLGVDPAVAAEGLGTVRPSALRGEVRRIGDLHLVLDCYNANPQSVRASLDLLAEQPDEVRRVAVLGSMLELGGQSAELHLRTLRDALDREVDLVVATGAFARAVAQAEGPEGVGEGDRLLVEEDPELAYERLRPLLEGDETVLLKGSRGVSLERLVPRFEEDFASGGDGEPAPPPSEGEA